MQNSKGLNPTNLAESGKVFQWSRLHLSADEQQQNSRTSIKLQQGRFEKEESLRDKIQILDDLPAQNNEPKIYKKTEVTSNVDKPLHSITERKNQYGIGISGFDRITNRFYDLRAKAIWGCCFIILTVGCFFQCSCCIYEYNFGKPAVSVELKQINTFHFPRVMVCPLEIHGRNLVTDRLKSKYRSHFHLDSKEEVSFWDLIKLPDENMTSLWNLINIDDKHIKCVFNCSVSKQDQNCVHPQIEEIHSSSGRCVTVTMDDVLKLHGPVSWWQVVLERDQVWRQFQFYLRGWSIPVHGNPRYLEVDAGMPSPFEIHATFIMERIEVINLNTTMYPCEDEKVVERCVDKCIEYMLYSKVPCRLPFMMNYSLPDCTEPLLFKKSYEISKDIMKKSEFCRSECPRKCEDSFLILNGQYNNFANEFKTTCRILDFTVPFIKEEKWYTFTNLFADIGGSLGFFLDVTLLTMFEFLEVLLEYIAKRKKKQIGCQSKSERKLSFWSNRKTRRNRISSEMQDSTNNRSFLSYINLGIVGCDRLLSKRYSSYHKGIWLICIALSTTVCLIQIHDAVNEFEYGDPNVKLVIEKNKTLKYPALTVCPFRPFEHWYFIHYLREQYKELHNSSDSDGEISLSSLFDVPDINIIDFWDERNGIRTKNIFIVDVNCVSITQLEPNEEDFNVSLINENTINGRCVTIKISPAARFRGPSTAACIGLAGFPETTSKYQISMFLHDDNEDIRTIDPHLGIPLNLGIIGIWSISTRTREHLNRQDKPCREATEVYKCRSRCYDALMEEIPGACRLPFLKNESLKNCSTAESFNKTMEKGFSLTSKKEDEWCNCPRICKEYIYNLNVNHGKGLKSMIAFLLQNPNNNIIVSKEYFQMNSNTLFANICGSLGLYLGFSALTIIEFVEAAIVILLDKISKLTNKSK